MTFLRLLACTVMFVAVLDMTSLAHYEAQWGWLLTATWSVSTHWGQRARHVDTKCVTRM